MLNQSRLLLVTAVIEVGAGLALLCLPWMAIGLLLDMHQPATESAFIARLAGAALLTIGVICYLARNDQHSPAQLGVIVGILIYNMAATLLLAYAGLGLNMTGVLLWPAVVLHAVLTAWCITSVQVAVTQNQTTHRS